VTAGPRWDFDCTDATKCWHKPTKPPEGWAEQRELTAKWAVQQIYADYPDSHKRAILRARQERPGWREEYRRMLWARASYRRKR
jgi:hypothetical protein